jgi:hypothetical protein
MLGGDGGSDPRCPQCGGNLRLDDPSEGRYECDNCTAGSFFDDGTGQIVEVHGYRGLVYEQRKAAGMWSNTTYRGDLAGDRR